MFRLRDAVNQGIAVGPRMVLCGRPVAIIGGHMGYFGSEATGPVEARATTRQLIKEGRRLHQDHGDRRQYPHVIPAPAVF